jgi:outer membrane receptor protein involved in Fe transport
MARALTTRLTSNIATTETANIERYDVLKGPAAILYGQGEPGGVINYITKKPQFDRLYTTEGIVGSFDYYRGEVDLTGPFNSQFAYRLVSSFEDSESHRDHTDRQRILVAPSVAYRPTEQTTIVGQFEYITDEYTQDRGQVLEGDNTSGFFYSRRLSGTQFFGIPGWNNQTESDYFRGAILADHRFNENNSVSLNASSTRVDKTLFDSSPRNGANGQVVAPNGDVNIRPLLQSGEGESDTIVGRYKLDLPTGSLFDQPIEHNFLFRAILNGSTTTQSRKTASPMSCIMSRRALIRSRPPVSPSARLPRSAPTRINMAPLFRTLFPSASNGISWPAFAARISTTAWPMCKQTMSRCALGLSIALASTFPSTED